MKYVVFLGDGMADYPNEKLGGKTPLELAVKPNIDAISKNGIMGLCKTVDDSLSPGSDVANLSVLGYDPIVYYSGRSPLEALSIGVDLKDSDVTFRANLVTLSQDEPYEEKTMVDYSSDEITTEESKVLIEFLSENIKKDGYSFHSGISYRHLLVHDGGSTNITLTPPHDISDKKVTEYLPEGDNADVLLEIMKKSYSLLKNHPINQKRTENGKHPANSLWIWGEGKKPRLDSFSEKFGLKGSIISAVDLLKGIGKGAKMNVPFVEGATGNVDTNFEGKASAAIDELKSGQDFVYIHVEAPDECGHRCEIENKIRAIELIDEKIIGPVMEYLKNSGEEYAVLVMPDHPTPLSLKTHVRDAVPFAIFRSDGKEKSGLSYTEKNAEKTGLFVDKGCKIMPIFTTIDK
ncbi:MAG: cofactor-independent phosphoglycerate mutase [Ruminococcaceae bacterium]|nr:cofactor-independent phosphoglycerate mutase [Oscillospiraceae bacterium]